MATLVCFHAHPDDEAIATGGTMAKAAAAGHRVVLVVATRGEHGEVVPGVLDDGEQLGLRRVQETYESAAVLDVDRVEFLGYVDSGMIGEPENDGPYSFWSADVEQAAVRLAGILREEQANGPVVLTIYDDHGGYGHPDHIQVHRVGARAAEMVGVDRCFQATMNRDRIKALMAASADALAEAGVEQPDTPEQDDFGSPEEIITHGIDVADLVTRKRSAMIAHASQIGADSFFLVMPMEAFVAGFGMEWFIEHEGAARAEGAPMGDDLFAGLADEVAILIDEAVWPFRGRMWAHLVSDTSIDELHAFADRLQIPRRAFQGDHYDVPAPIRLRALELGAEPVPARELVRRLRASGLRLNRAERLAHTAGP